MAISQTDRLIRIAIPLGEDTFIVLAFEGTEAVSMVTLQEKSKIEGEIFEYPGGYAVSSSAGKELATIRIQARQDFRSGTSDGDQYLNHFNCIPHTTPCRPEQTTPKPVIAGSQTAIVTGRVYHGKNKPSCDLPAEKTKITIMSDSSKGGNSSEIRFDNLKGSEEYFTRAANYLQKVGDDFTLKVTGNITIDASGMVRIRGAKDIINP